MKRKATKTEKLISELVNALKPFADIMEAPEEWPGDDLNQWTVSVKDIIAAKKAIAKATKPL